MSNDAETIAELARKAASADIINSDDGRSFLIMPEGTGFTEVSDPHGLFLNRPSYIKQSVTLQTRDSLVEYVNRFKRTETLLFADMDKSSIAALIDYHTPGDGKTQEQADHVAHRATMTLPFSEEWRIWTGVNGKLVPQLEFARFLEENGADVRAPEAAELLEACRDLQAHRKVNFIKAVRTASDNENFEFTEETEMRNKKSGIELPTRFVLGIPVYFGEADTELHAFLRWRLDDGALLLGIALNRVEHVRQAVFHQIVADIAARTECLPVFGKAN